MLTEMYVNGKKITKDISPTCSLLDFLRDVGCVSVRRGCNTANCGICTVWVDEQPVLSCSYLAVRANEKHVVTLEGVKEQANEFTAFLTKQGGEQCGFCMPGFIMAVLALKKELNGKVPTREEVNDYLKGNLCRCSGYEGQLRGIKNFLQWRKESKEQKEALQ